MCVSDSCMRLLQVLGLLHSGVLEKKTPTLGTLGNMSGRDAAKIL